MSLTIDELEAEVAARVVALTSVRGTSDYAQGSTPSWTEAEAPLTVELQPSQIGHLGFVVAADDAPNADSRRDQSADYARLATSLEVTFGYHLRPASQRADGRLAARAGRDVVRAVMAPWAAANVVLENAGRRALSADGEWMLTSCLFTVFHDFPL